MTVPQVHHFPSIPSLRWGVATHVGCHRAQNEDAFAIEPEVGLFMVSDGMGGHQGGQLASRTVVQDLAPAIESKLSHLGSRRSGSIRAFLTRLLGEQNRQLHLEGISESGYKGMGATVVLALVLEARAYIANLGDSRMYRFRNKRLRQFSRDHSVVAELLEGGHITPQEAEYHEERGVITHYVGMAEKPRPHVRSFSLRQGDRMLLCTDGLTDMVPDATIRRVLQDTVECQSCCEALVSLANQGGGWDNITVLVVDWQG